MHSARRSTESDRHLTARHALSEGHVGLVHFLARRLHSSLADEAELDELVSAGMMGLVRAAETFDRGRGLAFTTFATPRVRGARMRMRDIEWGTRVSADAADRRIREQGRTTWTPDDTAWATALRDTLIARTPHP